MWSGNSKFCLCFCATRESENKKEEKCCATDDMTKLEELVVAISLTHSEELEKLAGVTAVLLSCSVNIVLLPTGVYNDRGTNAGYILEAKQFTYYSLQHPTFFHGIGISVPTTTSRVRVTTSPPPLTISPMRAKAFFASDVDSRFEGYPRNFTSDVFLILPSINDIDWRYGNLVQFSGFSCALLYDSVQGTTAVTQDESLQPYRVHTFGILDAIPCDSGLLITVASTTSGKATVTHESALSTPISVTYLVPLYDIMIQELVTFPVLLAESHWSISRIIVLVVAYVQVHKDLLLAVMYSLFVLSAIAICLFDKGGSYFSEQVLLYSITFLHDDNCNYWDTNLTLAPGVPKSMMVFRGALHLLFVSHTNSITSLFLLLYEFPGACTREIGSTVFQIAVQYSILLTLYFGAYVCLGSYLPIQKSINELLFYCLGQLLSPVAQFIEEGAAYLGIFWWLIVWQILFGYIIFWGWQFCFALLDRPYHAQVSWNKFSSPMRLQGVGYNQNFGGLSWQIAWLSSALPVDQPGFPVTLGAIYWLPPTGYAFSLACFLCGASSKSSMISFVIADCFLCLQPDIQSIDILFYTFIVHIQEVCLDHFSSIELGLKFCQNVRTTFLLGWTVTLTVLLRLCMCFNHGPSCSRVVIQRISKAVFTITFTMYTWEWFFANQFTRGRYALGMDSLLVSIWLSSESFSKSIKFQVFKSPVSSKFDNKGGRIFVVFRVIPQLTYLVIARYYNFQNCEHYMWSIFCFDPGGDSLSYGFALVSLTFTVRYIHCSLNQAAVKDSFLQIYDKAQREHLRYASVLFFTSLVMCLGQNHNDFISLTVPCQIGKLRLSIELWCQLLVVFCPFWHQLSDGDIEGSTIFQASDFHFEEFSIFQCDAKIFRQRSSCFSQVLLLLHIGGSSADILASGLVLPELDVFLLWGWQWSLKKVSHGTMGFSWVT